MHPLARSAAIACAFVFFASAATAQGWPNRPVRLMVGFGPGGGTDVVARIVAEPLGELLGQRVVVENKPGAGGTLAGDMVAKGNKEGYDALMISSGHTVSAVMIKALPYDAVKDFAPVSVVATSAYVVVAPKAFPANNLKELIAIAKKDPGKLNYGTVGVGSTQHLTAELLRQRAGIEAQHVGFRTTPEVVTALLRNDVSYAVELVHAVRGQVQSGDLKILAFASGQRVAALPDVPTVIESGIPDFDVVAWYGLVFPAGVPAPVIEKTHRHLTAVLARDTVRTQFGNVGAVPAPSSPQAFGTLIGKEVDRWRGVTKAAGIEAK